MWSSGESKSGGLVELRCFGGRIEEQIADMVESVGRTKRSAVPAGVWQLPERRCAWSGLPRNPALTLH